MMKRSLLLAGAAMLFSAPAFAQTATTPAPAEATAPMTVSSPDEFVEMATISNMFEIQSSELAREKSETAEVEEFAQHMIEDHTAAAEKMTAAVEAVGGLTVPTELDARHQEMIAQLEAAEGEEFDQQYLEMQVAAHEEAVALFEGFSENGEDSDLKTFAEETLPTLQEHLEEVQGLEQ